MNSGGTGDCGANEIVGQEGGPHFAMHHLRRLAPNMSQVHRRFNAANIQFGIPSKSIQLSDVFFAEFIGIDQCCNNC